MVEFVTLSHVKEAGEPALKSCIHSELILGFEEVVGVDGINTVVILSEDIPHDNDNDRYMLVAETVDEVRSLILS